MITERTRRVLGFLKQSVQEEGEELRQARRFVDKLEELNELEQLMLGCALKSRRNLEQFCTTFRT